MPFASICNVSTFTAQTASAAPSKRNPVVPSVPERSDVPVNPSLPTRPLGSQESLL